MAVFSGSTPATDELPQARPGGDEIIIDRYPADGKILLLWLAPEYGFRQAYRSLAEGLAAQGIEWDARIA